MPNDFRSPRQLDALFLGRFRRRHQFANSGENGGDDLVVGLDLIDQIPHLVVFEAPDLVYIRLILV